MWRHCLLSGMAAWLAAATPASAYIAYVSNEKSNTVSVIDTAARQVTDTIAVGLGPLGIALTHDGFAYVADAGSNDVAVIDTATDQVVVRIPVGQVPSDVAVGRTLP